MTSIIKSSNKMISIIGSVILLNHLSYGSPQQIGGSSQNGGQIGGSSQTGGGQLIGGVGAPGYLSVPGWETCLGNYTPSTADHSQYCLPNTKPNSCNQNSWEQLKDVFQGECPIKCYVSPNDTPIFNHGLQKFFGASGNQKTCDEGVKQCQRYVAKDGEKGYGFHCGTPLEMPPSVVSVFSENDAHGKNPFNLAVGDKYEILSCGEDLCNSAFSMKSFQAFMVLSIFVAMMN